jgi:hypothetical protein
MTGLIRLEKLAELSRFSGNCQSETVLISGDYPPIPAIFDLHCAVKRRSGPMLRCSESART